MSRRFFFDSTQKNRLSSYDSGEVFTITQQIHHHWCRVLRANVGEQAVFFDGFGGEYQVELVEIAKKTASVKLLSFSAIDNTPKMLTNIGLVMSRGDRMDYAVQKATELGVTSIQLLTSQHGEVHLKPAQIDKKLNHWQQVAISACEQCGMNRVPILLPPLTLMNWLEQIKVNNYLVFDNICNFIKPIIVDDFYQQLLRPVDVSLVLAVPESFQNQQKIELAQLLLSFNNGAKIDNLYSQYNNFPYIRLLIGAEGGLSLDETNQAQLTNFIPWQIGNRVLRTETAPVVALATLQAVLD